jgi:3-oxoacyl-[acyl-carrier-protein] synthase III
MNDIYLSALDYALGEPARVDALEQVRAGGPAAELLGQGLREYRRSDLTPPELARRSLEATLRSAGVEPGSVDALVYSTESCSRREYYTDDVASLCVELGLERAQVVGVFGSSCANAFSAVRVARNLVLAEGLRRVLVVTSDVLPADQPRVPAPPISVTSDAAVSCLVGREPVAGFRVVAASLTSDATVLRRFQTENHLAVFQKVRDELRALCQGHLRAAGRAPRDYRQVFTNNYTAPVMHMFAMAGGFEPAQVYLDNVPRISHATTCDVLVNLADYCRASGRAPGELFALLSTGPYMWGLLSLEAT